MTLQTTVAGQNMELLLQGTKGQRIAIDTSTDFSLCGVLFTVADPAGNQIYGNGCAGAVTFTDLIVLPADGTYILRVDPGGTGVGTWTATVWTVPPDLGGVLQVDGPPYQGKIVKAGQNGALQIDVSDVAGFALQVSNNASQCGFYLAVKAPSGEVVQANGCAGGVTTMTLSGLTQSGTYTVVFDPAGMEQPDIQIKAVGP